MEKGVLEHVVDQASEAGDGAARQGQAMPSGRLPVLSLPSVVTNVASREALTFWAILSSPKSHETLFQLVAPGARYWGDSTRRGETASCIAVAPFGQSRPSLT